MPNKFVERTVELLAAMMPRVEYLVQAETAPPSSPEEIAAHQAGIERITKQRSYFADIRPDPFWRF